MPILYVLRRSSTIRVAFLCVLLPALSGCETRGPLTHVTPGDTYRYSTTVPPVSPEPDYPAAVPEQRPSVNTGAEKSDISSCKGKQLSCVYDVGGVALGQPRTSGDGLIRRAFKAPMHVPGTMRVASGAAGTVSVGSNIGHDRPSRIFTVYYNERSGVISRVVF